MFEGGTFGSTRFLFEAKVAMFQSPALLFNKTKRLAVKLSSSVGTGFAYWTAPRRREKRQKTKNPWDGGNVIVWLVGSRLFFVFVLGVLETKWRAMMSLDDT